MKYRELGKTGLRVSVIGFGASPLGDVFGPADPAECERAVHGALDRGINFFDVSPYYGYTLAEQRLGQALKGRREQAVLATKCGRYGDNEFDFSTNRVRKSLEDSLRRLQTDYLDLLLVHDIEFGDLRQIVGETLPVLRQARDAGKTRAIGVSGYPLPALRRVAGTAEMDVILSYGHYNLLVRDLDTGLSPVLAERGIGLVNASPLLMGVIGERPLPAWHPAPPEVRAAGRRIAQVCREYNVPPESVALRFCLGHPYAATTLVGMLRAEQVEANVGALNAHVPDELSARIEEIAAPLKNGSWTSGRPENN